MARHAWTTRAAVCVAAVFSWASAPVAAGTDPPLTSDGFEDPTPQMVVRDAVDRSGVLRLAVAEYWYSNLQLPGTLGLLGFDDPYPAGAALAALQSGTLVLDFAGDLAGESLGFAPWRQAGALRWVCGHAAPPIEATLLSGSNSASHTTLPDVVLPDACRSEPSPATRVDEAWFATGAARTGVAEHWISTGTRPATLATVGLDDPLPVARARLRFDDGLLIATFVDPLEGETLAIALWQQAITWRWVCGNAPAPVGATLQSDLPSSARTSVPDALLPAACRSDRPLTMQVRDVLSGMSAASIAIGESWARAGTLPATLAGAGLQDPLPVGLAWAELDGGVLVASFVGDLGGERVGVAPWLLNGALSWVCGYADAPAGAVALATNSAAALTTLDPALLPAACR